MSNRLRDVRVLKRITQLRLQLLSGVSATKISFLENGLIQPSQKDVNRLSTALGVSPQEIFPVDTNEDDKRATNG